MQRVESKVLCHRGPGRLVQQEHKDQVRSEGSAGPEYDAVLALAEFAYNGKSKWKPLIVSQQVHGTSCCIFVKVEWIALGKQQEDLEGS